MKYFAELNGKSYEVEVTGTERKPVIRLNGNLFEVDEKRLYDRNQVSYLINRRSYETSATEEDGDYSVHLAHQEFFVKLTDGLTRRLQKLGIQTKRSEEVGAIKAPMPGLIVKILVKEGDVIVENDGLMIIEAMKMENEIRSKRSGRIAKISVTEGKAVEYGEELLELEKV
ncbi:MAG: hypothetical protein B6244_03335 [Candidatus Cloacimonetes bacterium 4572_55]|nr:MAG: hypothetical protein B6244_03335 [Candidatus Cloacimonetes bacterium 4572_55]